MDSQDLIQQLETSFLELRHVSLEPRYSGPVDDIASHLTMSDTFIAGIAHTVLSGKRPLQAHLTILHQPTFPPDKQGWRTASGEIIDLTDYPEILNYARVIDRVRSITLQLLSDPNFVPRKRLRPTSVGRLLRGNFGDDMC